MILFIVLVSLYLLIIKSSEYCKIIVANVDLLILNYNVLCDSFVLIIKSLKKMRHKKKNTIRV